MTVSPTKSPASSTPSAPARMREYLQRVATGPEMSKPLSRAQAGDAMRMILDREVNAVQAGIFLIAMRMKRETDDENLGMLDALLTDDGAYTVYSVQSDVLVDIADPFNGYVRGVPATPFLPAVLAACGVNAYTHGVGAAPPKYGVTAQQILAAAGVAVDHTPAQVAQRINDPNIGWGYLDQARYHPKLHALLGLRAQMVKRACLTTLEVLLGPLRARATHLCTGYVHKAYPPLYLLLARAAGYDGAMIVRGVEGGCIPSLNQPAKLFCYDRDGDGDSNSDGDGDRDGGNDRQVRITPEEIAITQPSRAIPIPSQWLTDTPASMTVSSAELNLIAPPTAPVDTKKVAEYAAELGANALAGEAGAMRDSLIYAGALCLRQTGDAADLTVGAAKIRAALDSGDALARFTANANATAQH